MRHDYYFDRVKLQNRGLYLPSTYDHDGIRLLYLRWSPVVLRPLRCED